jgi:hypothetical protein
MWGLWGVRRRVVSRSLVRVFVAVSVCVLALVGASPARGVALPVLSAGSVSALEGHAGSRLVLLPVTLFGAAGVSGVGPLCDSVGLGDSG